MKTVAVSCYPCLFAAILCGGGIVVGGCRQKNEAGQVAAVVEAARQKLPKVLGYVRLADLVKASPLQADVQRLQDAQKRLVRFDTLPSASRDVSVMAGYVLPPLPDSDSRGVSQAAAALRQKDARTRLARNVERNLQSFGNDARQNDDRRAAQKQSEQIAKEEITGAGVLRRVRQAGERETRNLVAGRTGELTAGRSRNEILQAQLTPGTPTQEGGLPPVFDQTAFEAEIAKLKADPKASGISERARLELKRRDNQVRIDALEREIRELVAQGTANVGAEIARVRAERLSQIKAEVAYLKQDDSTLQIIRSERATLAQVLSAESTAARRAQGVIAIQGKNNGVIADAITLDGFGADRSVNATGSGDVVRARQAVNRIKNQQHVLQALIVADARESIRDSAQIHNVDVVVIEPGSSSSTLPLASKRRDMTSDFKRWFLSVGAGNPQLNGETSKVRKSAGKGRA